MELGGDIRVWCHLHALNFIVYCDISEPSASWNFERMCAV